MIYVVGIVILIIIVLAVIFFFKYIKLRDIKISLDICIDKINDILNTKFQVIENILKNINDETIKKEFDYDEKASVYDRENCLFDIAFKVNKYAKESKKKNLKNDIDKLISIEENLDGLKDFYNTNVINYNEVFLKKPFNKLFKLLKFEQYKAFKVRKLQEYEIFKN